MKKPPGGGWRDVVDDLAFSDGNRGMDVVSDGDFIMPMQAFSKDEINRAGAIVAGRNAHPVSDEVLAAFSTVHKWRDGHLIPMRAMRQELKRLMTECSVAGQTSGRLKRFQSIRRKLQRSPVKLHKLQDLAGCRLIVDDISGIAPVVAAYTSGRSRHELIKQNDYISTPKIGGYRSHHLVLVYSGDSEKTGGNRLTTEIQIRTRLQHAWATAVEAIGAVSNDDLKSGQGDPRWLRFLELMSAEFAAEECTPLSDNVPGEQRLRREEIIDLERELNAVTNLESYRRAIGYVRGLSSASGQSFTIAYNSVERSVEVRASRSFTTLSDEAWEADKNESANAVYVEVDRVDELVSAYPNYFLDVQMFTERLRSIVAEPPKAANPAKRREPYKPAHPISSDAWLAEWVNRSTRKR